MSVKNYSQTLFMLLSFAFVTHITYNYFKQKQKKVKKPDKQTEIHEAIWFTSDDHNIKKSKHSRCMITRSMERLLYYVGQPRHNLDICMYVWTNQDIANVVMKLHLRGVKVRVIVDADMAFTNGSVIKKLVKYGIPVRWMKSTNLMHNKFCLVDTLLKDEPVSPFVIAGSLNWTNQGLSGNYESCIVTSAEPIVTQLSFEFEKLWLQFKPVVEYNFN